MLSNEPSPQLIVVEYWLAVSIVFGSVKSPTRTLFKATPVVASTSDSYPVTGAGTTTTVVLVVSRLLFGAVTVTWTVYVLLVAKVWLPLIMKMPFDPLTGTFMSAGLPSPQLIVAVKLLATALGSVLVKEAILRFDLMPAETSPTDTVLVVEAWVLSASLTVTVAV